jgi:ATP-binding cassette, subfamily B, bacterial
VPKLIAELCWPEAHLCQLMPAFVRAARLPVSSEAHEGADLEAYCDAAGLDCERVALHGDSLAKSLRSFMPGIVVVPGVGYLAAIDCKRSWIHILPPSGRLRRLPLSLLCDALLEQAEPEVLERLRNVLGNAGIPEKRRTGATRAMVGEILGKHQIATGWQIRTSPTGSFTQQLRDTGMWRQMLLFGSSHVAQLACLVAAWISVGRGAISGRTDPGWLVAWALLLLTMAALRALTTSAQGVLAVGAGGLLKQRLLAGALAMDFDFVRGKGTGQLLGTVLEAEGLESLALNTGMASALTVFEAAIAFVVLCLGAAPVLQPILFAICIGAALFLASTYWRARLEVALARLTMMQSLLEKMVGHRTRLAQLARPEWHRKEDGELTAYMSLCVPMDRIGAALWVLPARCWLIAGILALSGALLAPGPSPAGLATSLGGLLLGYSALSRFCYGAAQLAGAYASWRHLAPIFRSGGHTPGRGSALTAVAHLGPAVVEAKELSYRYPGHSHYALSDCALRIEPGEKIVIEGSSGSGKSTLASILSGRRKPNSGLLLAGGVDPHICGEAMWRRLIATAPQYQENHIFSASLAFNLLMGGCWPAGPQELTEAREVCNEIGLGPLLGRMPGGLMHMVGETGWQLSQGERSRVFLARALLQRSQLIILDESLAALDPENIRKAAECALRRSQGLILIAHP